MYDTYFVNRVLNIYYNRKHLKTIQLPYIISMTDLNLLKERIEKLNKFHQIEVLKLLKKDTSCTLNENKNGIFVNLTNVKETLIYELEKYLDYVVEQEKSLGDIEHHKDMLTNTYFKDNKDNSSMTLNASV